MNKNTLKTLTSVYLSNSIYEMNLKEVLKLLTRNEIKEVDPEEKQCIGAFKNSINLFVEYPNIIKISEKQIIDILQMYFFHNEKMKDILNAIVIEHDTNTLDSFYISHCWNIKNMRNEKSLLNEIDYHIQELKQNLGMIEYKLQNVKGIKNDKIRIENHSNGDYIKYDLIEKKDVFSNQIEILEESKNSIKERNAKYKAILDVMTEQEKRTVLYSVPNKESVKILKKYIGYNEKMS